MHVNPRIAALLAQLASPALPGIDLSLARMEALLAALGNPQHRLPPVIHLAGTNGKGSTQAFLRGMYQAAGYRVHAYTSPHLVRFNERIMIADALVDDEILLSLLARVQVTAKDVPVTFFEATTAVALLAFAEHPADVVLLETGLGGRLDATNVVARPALTVITPIDFDHMEFLGSSIAAIAAEKAGILKAGVACISARQLPEAAEVLATGAKRVDAPLLMQGEAWDYHADVGGIDVWCGEARWRVPLPSLPGAHQLQNAALASVVARQCAVLPVTDEALALGVSRARWAGRLQRLQHGPLVEAWGERGRVMLDGAHNPSGARALAVWIESGGQPVTMVCGMMRRKDAAAFFAPFAGMVRRLVTVPVPGEECYDPAELAEAARQAGVAPVQAAADIAALADCLASDTQGTLLLTGSLFLVGHLLKTHG